VQVLLERRTLKVEGAIGRSLPFGRLPPFCGFLGLALGGMVLPGSGVGGHDGGDRPKAIFGTLFG
jgi:hypothetical protein